MAAAAFIARWRPSGGAELANAQSFCRELCDLLDVPHPEPKVASEAPDANAYVFEKDVTFKHGDGSTSNGRIDLYKRGCFVLEAKQGSANPADRAAPSVPLAAPIRHKRGTAVRGTPAWSQAMDSAYGQASQYARALSEWPPFLIVVDVGHAFAVYANFARDGKPYLAFPDPQSHRFLLDDLADDAIRDRLRRIWLDPMSLDPSRHAARVTTAVAERLAALATSLERQRHGAEPVADFLMRCLFTMFAEDVELLPRDSFTGLLEDMRDNPKGLASMLEALWREMDRGGFSTALRETVLRFNGRFFHDATALPLDTAQIDLLIAAARSDWSQVEPAIFGTLLERALDPKERHSLGAHFTPRAYVERLVFPTVIEPLRDDWQNVKAAAMTLLAKQSQSDKQLATWRKEAIELVTDFRRKLCQVRVLDPACGTGNFLYITLEHMKRLEGEVIETLADMGAAQEALDLAGATVDPHQFLGIEKNPRAVPIAELVLWIGYLQWHYRQHGKVAPAEPVLRDFRNIEHRDAVLAYDAEELVLDEQGQPVTRWDGETTKKHPVTGKDVPDDSARVPVYRYTNPRKAEWPEADFVVSNPPFLGSKRMRTALGDEYVDALQAAWPEVPQATDLVMRWWSHAADLVRSGRVRRFGLITTNSITGAYVRRAVEPHLVGPDAMSIVFAVPDHPWVDTEAHAAVRISMTVGLAGQHSGQLVTVTEERHGGADKGQDLVVAAGSRFGVINADLTVGADLTRCVELVSNAGLCSVGMKTIGAAFQVGADLARSLGLGITPGLDAHIRPYVSGRDLAQTARDKFVMDFFGLDEAELMTRFPACYQYLLSHAKPGRDENRNAVFRKLWWVIGHPRPQFRESVRGTTQYVATPETAKHRWLAFVPVNVVPDSTLVTFSLPDPYFLGILSSRTHGVWSLAAGSRLGVGNDPRYNKTRCFDPFPFPAATEAQAARIREVAEALDAHRKARQAEHPDLTMTNMYNVLEKLRAGEPLTAKDKKVHEQGLCSVLLKLHDDLDEAVFAAYGWPATLGDEELLERLVALNAERAEEESRGLIRYLRPDYQCPTEPAQLSMDTEDDDAAPEPAPARPPTDRPDWPQSLVARIALVQAAMKATTTPTTPDTLARTFKNAKTDQVAEILETLKTLGLLRQLESGSYAP
ncbi:MAG: class I SAM-dependent DNA methyltransferase [Deltaproteobacteria bacterium]|nr:class I SAM-dependent DNA methyltransferase [Deltaproteobacteria bacterium]